MTKKNPSKLNISAAIRDYLDDHPDAKPAAIVGWLKKQHRVTVTAQYVSTIKSSARAKTRNVISDQYRPLEAAKQFVKTAGDLDRARRLLDDYAALFV